MRRTLLPVAALFIVALGAAFAGPTPNGETRTQDELLDLAHQWAEVMQVNAYGIRHEPLPISVPLERDLYFAYDEDMGEFVVLAVNVNALPKANDCRVECASGWYACCLINGRGEPVCRCRRNGTNGEDCQAGGPGATACEISRNGNHDHHEPWKPSGPYPVPKAKTKGIGARG